MTFSRREVLTGVGTGIGALTLAPGLVGATTPGRYIVGTSSRAATAAAQARAETVHHVLEFGSVGQAVAGQFSPQAVRQLAQRADVRYVEADAPVQAISQSLPWGVDRVDAEVAHGSGYTGSNSTDTADLAIIDTGIDSDHPDLVDNLGSGYAVVNARGKYAQPWDDDAGHGTHCAGIADAVDNTQGVVGVADAATLHAVKVLDKRGSGYSSDVAAGINYVRDQGWDVGSMSLGASAGTQTLSDACDSAYSSGVLLVAAAGNSGGAVGYPAAYSSVVAVSATNKNDQLPSWSSRGPQVELAAPGVNIYSTYNDGGYATLSGTSMACPHVSGAAAMLMANGYTASGARGQLSTTAEDIGLSSNEQGAGLLDVANAFSLDSSDNLSGSTSSPPPSSGAPYAASAITFSQKAYGPGKSFHDVMTTVTVREDSNSDGSLTSADQVVSGATVTMTLSDGSTTWSFSGQTDSSGQVTFTLKKASSGTYTADITGISASSGSYDPSLSGAVTTASITII